MEGWRDGCLEEQGTSPEDLLSAAQGMIHNSHAAAPRKQREHHNLPVMGKPRFQQAKQGAVVGELHPWDLEASIPAWFPTSRLRDAHLTQFP